MHVQANDSYVIVRFCNNTFFDSTAAAHATEKAMKERRLIVDSVKHRHGHGGSVEVTIVDTPEEINKQLGEHTFERHLSAHLTSIARRA